MSLVKQKNPCCGVCGNCERCQHLRGLGGDESKLGNAVPWIVAAVGGLWLFTKTADEIADPYGTQKKRRVRA